MTLQYNLKQCHGCVYILCLLLSRSGQNTTTGIQGNMMNL